MGGSGGEEGRRWRWAGGEGLRERGDLGGKDRQRGHRASGKEGGELPLARVRVLAVDC